jgi:hypothetical protein
MSKYTKRTSAELNSALGVVKIAIERGRELIDHAERNPLTKGMQKLAASAPRLLERLERDQGKLQGALDKVQSNEASRRKKQQSSNRRASGA